MAEIRHQHENSVVFLIPVYDESQNLQKLSENLLGFAPSLEKFYLFVDDCSSDDSVEKIKACFPGEKSHIITKQENRGPGDSFNIGFNWILENYPDDSTRVVTMEADNTSDIHILERMLKINDLGYDLVLASVYAHGGGFKKTAFMRKLISLIANMLFRTIFDIRVLTLSSFYRVYNIAILRRVKSSYKNIIEEKGFLSMLEILLKCIKCDGDIIEVPMILKSDNRAGKSKMKVIKTGLRYVNFLLFNKIKKSPSEV